METANLLAQLKKSLDRAELSKLCDDLIAYLHDESPVVLPAHEIAVLNAQVDKLNRGEGTVYANIEEFLATLP